MVVNIGKNIASIVTPIFIIVIIAVLIFYFRSVYAKSEDERRKEKEFAKEGLFASIGKFFLGEQKEGSRNESDQTIDSEKKLAGQEELDNYQKAQAGLDDVQSKALVEHEKKLADLEAQLQNQRLTDQTPPAQYGSDSYGKNSSKNSSQKTIVYRPKSVLTPKGTISTQKRKFVAQELSPEAKERLEKNYTEYAKKQIAVNVQTYKPSTPIKQIKSSQIRFGTARFK